MAKFVVAAALAITAPLASAQECSACKWAVGQLTSYIQAHGTQDVCDGFYDVVYDEYPICIMGCETIVKSMCQTAVNDMTSGTSMPTPTQFCTNAGACGSTWRSRRQVSNFESVMTSYVSRLSASNASMTAPASEIYAEGMRLFKRSVVHHLMSKEVNSPTLMTAAAQGFTDGLNAINTAASDSGYRQRRFGIEASGSANGYSASGSCSADLSSLSFQCNAAASGGGGSGSASIGLRRSIFSDLTGDDLCAFCKHGVSWVEQEVRTHGTSATCNGVSALVQSKMPACTGACLTSIETACGSVMSMVISRVTTGSTVNPSEICGAVHACSSSSDALSALTGLRQRRQLSNLVSDFNSTLTAAGVTGAASQYMGIARSYLAQHAAAFKMKIATNDGAQGDCFPDTVSAMYSCNLNSEATTLAQIARGTSEAATTSLQARSSGGSDNSKSKLSAGDDVGIAIGAAALVAIIALIALFARSESKKAPTTELESPLVVSNAEYAGAN